MSDKEKIIAAINDIEDERVLFAIKRLLLIEEDEIPEWHKEELDTRSENLKSGKDKIYSWDEVKSEIKNID